MILSFKIKIKPEDYEIITQKRIENEKDNLVVGIYKLLTFRKLQHHVTGIETEHIQG